LLLHREGQRAFQQAHSDHNQRKPPNTGNRHNKRAPTARMKGLKDGHDSSGRKGHFLSVQRDQDQLRLARASGKCNDGVEVKVVWHRAGQPLTRSPGYRIDY